MPEGDQDHGGVAVAVAVALGGLDQLVDFSLGQMLGQAGQQAEAAAAMQEAERLNRRKADEQASAFAVAVGVQKLAANDIAGAIERLREAVRLSPDNARARYQLALALQRAGASREAQAQFAEARRLAPYLQIPPNRQAPKR